MDVADVMRWVLPIVLGGAALWLTQRNLSAVGKQGLEKLERLGLRQVPGTKGGSTFTGQYRGYHCGYHWGRTARLVARTQTNAGAVSGGSEFFVEVAAPGPVLAIVQRDDEHWRRFEGEVIPRTEIETGDAAFDARFRVRCDDAGWVHSLLTADVRAQLLVAPLVFLLHERGAVVFPLYFDGTRLFDDLGVSTKVAWSLFDRADVLLDTAICLADALRRATGGGGGGGEGTA